MVRIRSLRTDPVDLVQQARSIGETSALAARSAIDQYRDEPLALRVSKSQRGDAYLNMDKAVTAARD